MKGKIINHQLELFAAAIHNALFLYVDRDPIDAAWSLLQTRRHRYGDASAWWSFKTPDYEQLRLLDAYHQVVGQILSIRRDVSRALSRIDPCRWLRVDYNDLCGNPDEVFHAVVSLYKALGIVLQGVNQLRVSTANCRTMPREECRRLELALADFQTERDD